MRDIPLHHPGPFSRKYSKKHIDFDFCCSAPLYCLAVNIYIPRYYTEMKIYFDLVLTDKIVILIYDRSVVYIGLIISKF